VDEALFTSPPTLLIATVDKFARLAWDERSSAFFGVGGNRPPELVIQDELHLIAGALGSIAGLYEAALDTVLTRRGVRPKYIASTATIKMASQQVQRLYGRELAIFPPPGISCDNSFFSSTVPLGERPGRLYAGYLAPMRNRQECLTPLAGTLLAGPELLFSGAGPENAVLLDAWWTQVIYHGSLKGVGISHNSFVNSVPGYYRRLRAEASRHNGVVYSDSHPDPGGGGGPTGPVDTACDDDKAKPVRQNGSRIRLRPELAQLTSISSPEDNKRVFERLGRSYTEPDFLDAVFATNMVSVGLDEPRLALMVINGQPLTTAEYIQASSRVGRGLTPGLVLVNYYRDQARSLSHYEDFRPYHESFYRYVEPTSITPFTYQARVRALHAALVVVIRHTVNFLSANGAAGDLNPSHAEVADAVACLAQRCAVADPERAADTKAHLNALLAEWGSHAERCRCEKRQLNYCAKDNDKSADRLLYNHDDNIKGIWPTLQSMRNVENSALLKLL
jgi:hypothetical protein